MKRLAVLRHAKSSWDDPRLDDFDRPLNDRGRKAARLIGREMKRREMHFDLVLASTAVRVGETIDRVQEEFRFTSEIRFEQRIYEASAGTLLELVRTEAGESDSMLLVGHNPGLQQLLLDLTDRGERGLRDSVKAKFPTAALAVVELPTDRWSEVKPGSGTIVELILPRELAQKVGIPAPEGTLMSGETDLERLLRSMEPQLSGTAYTFAVAASGEVPQGVSIIGTFVEDEGLSIVAPLAEIGRAGLAHAGSWAKISLIIHSSLSAVGLTASVASALAAHGISANMIAAYYHDHIFVPWDKRHEAMSILNAIGQREG